MKLAFMHERTDSAKAEAWRTSSDFCAKVVIATAACALCQIAVPSAAADRSIPAGGNANAAPVLVAAPGGRHHGSHLEEALRIAAQYLGLVGVGKRRAFHPAR